MKKSKFGRVTFVANLESSRLHKSYDGDFDYVLPEDKSLADENIEIKESKDAWKHSKTIPCPLGLDNSDVVKEINNATQKLNLNYKLNVEISLQPKTKLHKHDVWIDENQTDQNPEMNEFDLGSLSCSVPFEIETQIDLKLQKKKLDKTENDENVKKLIEKSQDQADQERLTKSERTFLSMSQYMESNLQSELDRIIERLMLEYFSLTARGNDRSENIKIFLGEEEKVLRNRISSPKGRTPIKEQEDYTYEKEDFIEECLETLKKLDKKKSKITKTQLAESLFRDLNPLQTLRRKFTYFDLSFEGILKKYSEQKSS